ncbi:DUF2813 domain-containing protein [Lonsdalea populi]|uniref:DUF2813 domain-containing protein n=1 Tax=Lonsdalea populi TaxID=1172565 RepID=UPI000A1EB17E|nr:DUF2813 domain-containing protein [Lonsdalea populi]OSN02276.1 hypothetical protein AU499_01540 [Lonsdalea populi]QPQ22891.1 DUF2813 domain-containing protein [Lonsdalea populi]RAT47128.1 hypothetical protein AU494_02290 [Lonsdalea populi]RAT47698.1 hypothetical protein AU495_00575 [Lonsdalea populi]RAT56707.1 hypothetical protein AU500_09390 [Lonsdalea populi]
MYLERVDIDGFQGINRLSLVLDENTVLIGENAWGKSSLLDALSLLLSPAPPLYCFQSDDFHFIPGEESRREKHLQVVFTFLETDVGHHQSARYRKLLPLFIHGNDRLKPLLRFAQRMGIEWHVLVDGDDAGKKYAATTRSLLLDQHERDHLTMLPARDMEYFMYKSGFAQVYHRVAQLPDNVPLSPPKIISKAIHRTSKPDLAIEVAMDAAARGEEAIPPLIRHMFARVLWLARGRAD